MSYFPTCPHSAYPFCLSCLCICPVSILVLFLHLSSFLLILSASHVLFSHLSSLPIACTCPVSIAVLSLYVSYFFILSLLILSVCPVSLPLLPLYLSYLSLTFLHIPYLSAYAVCVSCQSRLPYMCVSRYIRILIYTTVIHKSLSSEPGFKNHHQLESMSALVWF